MQLTTKATLDNGANNDAVWQYIGIPIAETYFEVPYITWLYEWNEKNNWIDLKNVPQPVLLRPFLGYTITQYGHGPYEFSGPLIKEEKRIVLTKTIDGLDGENMFANSYMAPIDVRRFSNADFVGNIEKTFYVYNSGSWNQWNEQTQGGTSLVSGTMPGSFVAIPVGSAAELGESALTYIAPMQGVCVKTNEDGAVINLNYQRLVWDAPASTHMNDPMKAPRLGAKEEEPDAVDLVLRKRDSIAQSYRQRELALRHRVRLNITSANSGADHLYLLERDGYTAQYDNGYDAKKMMNDNLVNIYTNNEAGQMAVEATDKLNGTYVAFVAGEDSEYTLFVTSVLGQNLKLRDMITGDEIVLTEGATYTFNAVPNSEDNFRFVIIEEAGIPTGWDSESADAIRIWKNKENVYIANATAHSTAEIFTAAGNFLKQVSFDYNTTISTEDIPEGIYTIRVKDSVLKFFVKH